MLPRQEGWEGCVWVMEWWYQPQLKGPSMKSFCWLRKGRNNTRPAQRHMPPPGNGWQEEDFLFSSASLLVLCCCLSQAVLPSIFFPRVCTLFGKLGGGEYAHYNQRSNCGVNPTPHLTGFYSRGQRENNTNLRPSSNLWMSHAGWGNLNCGPSVSLVSGSCCRNSKCWPVLWWDISFPSPCLQSIYEEETYVQWKVAPWIHIRYVWQRRVASRC